MQFRRLVGAGFEELLEGYHRSLVLGHIGHYQPAFPLPRLEAQSRIQEVCSGIPFHHCLLIEPSAVSECLQLVRGEQIKRRFEAGVPDCIA